MSDTGSGHLPENLALGAALSSLSFFCTAVMSALARATEELTSTAVVLLFQNLICLLFITPVIIKTGWRSLRTEKIGLHVLRAATGTGAWYALFVAITMMPLTNAILLTFSAPLWMPVIAWALFRESASRAIWVGAGIGFVGVVLVLQPHHAQFNIGAVFALAGAFCLALALMSVRWLGATEPTSRILFYYFFLSTLLVAPFAVLTWKPFGLRASLYLIGIALTLLLSQVLIVLAYRFASAVKVSPFIYTVIVFTALIDWVLWDRAPTLFIILGMVLVIGGGVVAIRKRADVLSSAVETIGGSTT
jgi:drug/metabolite transporter (DMT)-like permease